MTSNDTDSNLVCNVAAIFGDAFPLLIGRLFELLTEEHILRTIFRSHCDARRTATDEVDQRN